MNFERVHEKITNNYSFFSELEEAVNNFIQRSVFNDLRGRDFENEIHIIKDLNFICDSYTFKIEVNNMMPPRSIFNRLKKIDIVYELHNEDEINLIIDIDKGISIFSKSDLVPRLVFTERFDELKKAIKKIVSNEIHI